MRKDRWNVTAKEAEQSSIIEWIKMRMEELQRPPWADPLWAGREIGLKRMSNRELQQLYQELQQLEDPPAWHQLNAIIVGAICASGHTREAAEAKKWDALDGTAKVDMYL